VKIYSVPALEEVPDETISMAVLNHHEAHKVAALEVMHHLKDILHLHNLLLDRVSLNADQSRVADRRVCHPDN